MALAALATLGTLLAPLRSETQVIEQGCVIRPSEVVALSASVAGRLSHFNVGRGDEVVRGDILAELEAGPERADLRIAEARAADRSQLEITAQRRDLFDEQVERNRSLSEAELLTRNRFDTLLADQLEAQAASEQARVQFELAQLEVARARSIVEEHVVRAPIDGVVVERTKAAGEFTGEREPVLTVAALDPLHVEVFAPIAISRTVAVGDRARVTPEPPYDTPREAVVDVVDSVFDASSATFGVRLTLRNPDRDLPAGLRCAIDFSDPAPD
ncbi:efflux RND transporter periplasmic adaptor subunit [Roseisalinus antarcticus]|uniref:Multidrug resistance protein MdtE n=1 Tax=Roseisalinus antarcticus TaxID=254357 RepID=A0A1Y5TTI2_9RHOB|nr:efflux RND transporter periplasmic adaptor subunit [Roseisalinus antarcticus]SLN72120.1 Multidrug resistance protein MdtE precursor [Roseisalinus antarcticus]